MNKTYKVIRTCDQIKNGTREFLPKTRKELEEFLKNIGCEFVLPEIDKNIEQCGQCVFDRAKLSTEGGFRTVLTYQYTIKYR